jgi:O-antigen/teichoic acid export membrane protein
MSVRLNIAANYVGQLYAALIGIALVPQYIQYIGVEAYGLVGFYTMLQGWFSLLDLGLTPTLGRETARYKGGALDAAGLRKLVRAFEGVFVAVGLLGALVLAAAAGPIAQHWLRLDSLASSEVERSIQLMALTVALRWTSGLYRGAIGGFERIVWLNGAAVLVATLRFVLVLPYLMFVGATPTHFFAYQLAIAVLELLILMLKVYRLLPTMPPAIPLRWDWRPLRRVMPFALSAAFTSAVWVLVTQTDKLVLSGMVPLTEYANFTLAVLVASGIVLLSNPVAGAILPRLTRLHAEGDKGAFLRVYRSATQLVAIIVTPAVLLLAFFPLQVLTAWTGQPELARQSAPILALYAVGNGILALSAFPYYLQLAQGDLRLHLIGNAVFVLLFIPLLYLGVSQLGAKGAGYAWVIANLLPFLIWLPLVHHRFLRGTHLAWLATDIGAIVVLPACAAALAARLVEWPASRGALLGQMTLLYLTLGALALIGSSTARAHIRQRLFLVTA